MLDSSIQEIKDRLPILELVQDFVQLKKAGTNYKGLCPFHSEKTPSFVVTPAKQMWYCFGCNLGGDIFEFIKLAENVEFGEALKILADRAGVELKKPTPEQVQLRDKKNVLYEINEAAAKYFAKVLWESESAKEALDYLRKRGLSDQTIKNWQLGWAPDDFHYLENFLAKNFSKKDIETAGLIIKKDSENSHFDRFRGRIMFPIVNLHGQAVGFTGRLLHEKPDTGKYVNSPETPIYNKSQVIFGLHQAKNTIRKENRVVLVEGNMDVITAHQAGFTQTVASSGTAFTETQLLILKRFAENLIFAFDSDSAGTTATRRTLELALNLGFNIKVVELREAKDPDELIRRGIGLWQKALDNAVNYVEFFFNRTLQQFDPNDVDGKREIAKQVIPLVARLTDQIVKAHFVRKLATSLNVAESAIWETVNKVQTPNPASSPSSQVLKRKTRLEWLTERVLGLLIGYPKPEILAQFEPADFGPLSKVYLALQQNSKPAQLASTFELLKFGVDTEIEEQALNPEQELKYSAMELNRFLIRQRMEEVANKLQLAENSKNREAVKNLSEEYVSLTKRMSQLG